MIIIVYYLGSVMDVVVIEEVIIFILFFLGLVFFGFDVIILKGVFSFEWDFLVIVDRVKGIISVW